MTKPLAFNYQDYEDLKVKYEDLLIKHNHALSELTNYKIRCRIAEADLKALKILKGEEE